MFGRVLDTLLYFKPRITAFISNKLQILQVIYHYTSLSLIMS